MEVEIEVIVPVQVVATQVGLDSNVVVIEMKVDETALSGISVVG
jgi:hypothetical protein